MTNQPFTVPGQRVRWAVAELRKAGIDASVQRGPDGNYLIAVDGDDRSYAADTLDPMIGDPPLLVEKRRRNWLQGWLQFSIVGIGALAVLWLSLAGAFPTVLTGIAVWGLAPVMIAGLGIPIVLLVVWLYMVNLRVPWALVLLVLGLFLALLAGSIVVSGGGL